MSTPSEPAPRALLMAGGRGRRLDPLTASVPKPLVTVAGTAVIDRMVAHLATHGILDITVATGHLGDVVRTHLAASPLPPGARIEVVEEPEPLGPAGAILLLDPRPSDVLLANADLVTDLDLTALLTAHRESGAAVTIAVRRHETALAVGVIDVDRDGTVAGWHEKPTLEHTVSMGVYVVSPPALEGLQAGTPLDMAQITEHCLARGLTVRAHRSDAYWIDIGSPADHLRAEEDARATQLDAADGRRAGA